MSDAPSRRPWGVQRRLEFIEFRLYWEGQINRADISDTFGVSTPQASTDLGIYKEIAPENLIYDSSLKVYLASNQFEPKLKKPDANQYLSQLRTYSRDNASDTWLGDIPDLDAVPIPFRKVESSILRTALTAIRERRSLEIFYHSMNDEYPEPMWRTISPHALASDGLRWHIRALCHRSNTFKDFILSRCRDCKLDDDAIVAKANDDWEWHEFLEIKLVPNPKLSAEQQKTIALDYQMQDGARVMNIRKALFYYFEKRLRLDIAEQADRPKETPVVVENYETLLKEVKCRQDG